MHECKICGNQNDNVAYFPKEMMFGTSEVFEYFRCNKCGCLQINDVPANLSDYYPSDYYSKQFPSKVNDIWPIKYIKRRRLNHFLIKRNITGSIIQKLSKTPVFYDYFIEAGIKPDSPVLDVGCGNGKLLFWMRREGFTNLTGIDPYIDNNIISGKELKIFRKEIKDLSDRYDLIMLHHSFEHMPDPVETMINLSEHLNQNGIILLRIPVSSSYAFEKYDISWFAFDAPRHLFLHTPSSIKILTEKAGLTLDRIVYDSSELQFIGSEQYLRGISMTGKGSYFNNPKDSIFSEEEIKSFREKAIELNKNNKGDTAIFYIKKQKV